VNALLVAEELGLGSDSGSAAGAVKLLARDSRGGSPAIALPVPLALVRTVASLAVTVRPSKTVLIAADAPTTPSNPTRAEDGAPGILALEARIPRTCRPSTIASFGTVA
jgi:hypothetical protein